MYKAIVIADSISDANVRLTTLQLQFPRFFLAEFNTHRVFSRNAASSRAIPTANLIQRVKDDPFIPAYWGSNKKGMQAGPEVVDRNSAVSYWIEALDKALHVAEQLNRVGVHKQLANRVLEPFMWVDVVVTATHWDNFFHLRMHEHAQPEFQTLAEVMYNAMWASQPSRLQAGDWHLPYVSDEEVYDGVHSKATSSLPLISAARCARVSYVNHEGTRDASLDLKLAHKLLADGHMSPFEHPAEALLVPARWANFVGWKQYRKSLRNEHDPLGPDHE